MHGKTVLITGASSGIGREMALLAHERGARLVLSGRDMERLTEVWDVLGYARPVEIITADLARPEGARDLHQACRDRGLTVDVLINNAGCGLYGRHVDLEPDGIATMVQLNVTSVAVLCRLFGEEMKARRAGAILNVASTAGYQPFPLWAAYGASKSFVLNFSEALAMELEDFGVTVRCLSPGPTESEFFNQSGLGNGSKGIMSPGARMGARTVAAAGLDLLESGALSTIPGWRNKLLAFSNRFAPRKTVARVSKVVSRHL